MRLLKNGGEVEQQLEEEIGDSLDFEEDDLDDVPDQDDSEVDEELRAFREKLREDEKNEAAKQKKKTKKPSKDQGVELGKVGIDKGFENIFTNKAAKYNGKLGGDEVFIDSSDEPSEDSDDELDILAQPGVDLPSKRKSNKLRYDSSSSISFFELALSTAHTTAYKALSTTTSKADFTTTNTSKVKRRGKKQPTTRATSSSTACISFFSVGMPPPSSVGRKRTRDVGFGVYTYIQTGRQVINPGRSSERVISSGSGVAFKNASQTIDLGFKPPGLK
ncbi:hypothetical protein KY285_002623 [Solanum tuberosum]|nr:hypothetical protein KY285_002623 [Solanum tuberosum]